LKKTSLFLISKRK